MEPLPNHPLNQTLNLETKFTPPCLPKPKNKKNSPKFPIS